MPEHMIAIAGWIAVLSLGVVFFIIEIGRMRADRRHASNQARLELEVDVYRRIFETSLDLILVTDRKGLLVKVSPSSKRTLGYDPEEMVGHVGIDFIYSGDLEPTRNEMRLARRGRETRNFECRYVHKDGHIVTLNWTGVWSEPEQRHFFIGRDATLRKRL